MPVTNNIKLGKFRNCILFLFKAEIILHSFMFKICHPLIKTILQCNFSLTLSLEKRIGDRIFLEKHKSKISFFHYCKSLVGKEELMNK